MKKNTFLLFTVLITLCLLYCIFFSYKRTREGSDNMEKSSFLHSKTYTTRGHLDLFFMNVSSRRNNPPRNSLPFEILNILDTLEMISYIERRLFLKERNKIYLEFAVPSNFSIIEISRTIDVVEQVLAANLNSESKLAIWFYYYSDDDWPPPPPPPPPSMMER